MREIKFRAWTQGQMWAPRNIFELTTYKHIQPDGSKLVECGYPSDTILMQYTGLKDKNGKEVYEGDIVKSLKERHYRIYQIEYKEQLGAFEGTGIDTGFTFSCYNLPVFGEVIGNIFEHPHLLQ